MLPVAPSFSILKQRQVLSRMLMANVTSSLMVRHATPLASAVPMISVTGPGGQLAAALELSALVNRPVLEVPSASLETSPGMPSSTPGSMVKTRSVPEQPAGGPQPVSALLTAVISSLIPTMPSPFASNDGHWLTGAAPS